jgi:hypothetical protein
LRSVKECNNISEEAATCNSYEDCTWLSSSSSLLGGAEAGSHGTTKAASTILVLFFLTLGMVSLYRHHKTAPVVVKEVKAFLG